MITLGACQVGPSGPAFRREEAFEAMGEGGGVSRENEGRTECKKVKEGVRVGGERGVGESAERRQTQY